MNIKNCRVCGRIFNYIAGPVYCPSCKESMEAKFQEVKEYIRAHKGVGVNQVAEACDVDPAQIRQWLREDRLEVTEDSALFLNCESCGAAIRSGRFCEKCKGSMARGFNNVLQSSRSEAPSVPNDDKPDNPRMRYIK